MVQGPSNQQFCNVLGTAAAADAGCLEHNESPSEHDWSVSHSTKHTTAERPAEGGDQTIIRAQTSDHKRIFHGATSGLNTGFEGAGKRGQERQVLAGLTEQDIATTEEINLRDQVSSLQLANPGRPNTNVLPVSDWVGEVPRTQPHAEQEDQSGRDYQFIAFDEYEARQSYGRHLLQSTPGAGAPGFGDPLDGWKTEWQYGLLAISLTLVCAAMTLAVTGHYYYRKHREMIIYADTDAFYQACAGALGEQVSEAMGFWQSA